MKRVLLLGSGGSGKSTFARRLSEITGLPVVHLDAHYWQPGWTPMAQQEWEELVREFAGGERWIIDGNYGGAELQARVERADTVLLFDLPRRVCLWRTVRREVLREARDDLAPGCEARPFSRGFLEFLKWVWDYPGKHLPRIMQTVEAHGGQADFHRFRSQADAERFITGLAAEEEATK